MSLSLVFCFVRALIACFDDPSDTTTSTTRPLGKRKEEEAEVATHELHLFA